MASSGWGGDAHAAHQIGEAGNAADLVKERIDGEPK
jgi:hypothetical protein